MIHPFPCHIINSHVQSGFSSGCTCLPGKVDDLFLVVALKTHAKTTKLRTPTVQVFPISKNIDSCRLLLCLGVHLQRSPVNLAQIFFSTLGVHVHPLHPLATPMLTISR